MTLFEETPAVLVLADGTVFEGYSVGATKESFGEVVFNTAMTGYQEILSDPSYALQMITFTAPHIGNVGANNDDMESGKVFASGVIIKEPSRISSNYRSQLTLDEFLKKHDVSGIGGVDTRALVLHLREHGSQMGVIASGDFDLEDLKKKVAEIQGMEGRDLVSEVSTQEVYEWTEGSYKELDSEFSVNAGSNTTKPHVIAYDFGVKHNILRLLVDSGFKVSVVPARTSADDVTAMKPDGIFLSNGPGDPAAVTYAIDEVKKLIGTCPIFGICLGHQILGLASGVETFKLKFGHRGGNHPVKDLRSEAVEISVQNHGFASKAEGIPSNVEITHINLNDNTVEGLEVKGKKAFSVQFHPECSPGPHDSQYHFNRFRDLILEIS